VADRDGKMSDIAANRRSNCSLTRAMDDKSATTIKSKILKLLEHRFSQAKFAS